MAHQGRETICDWSAQKGEAIKWAAFYSDCEHEVLEVTSGHRITLTYNLYGMCLPGFDLPRLLAISLRRPHRTASRANEADFTIISSA